MSISKWNMIIDVARCENCNNCVIAAKDEYVANEHDGYSKPLDENNSELIAIDRVVRGSTPVLDTAYLVRLCNHCDNAPCMKVGGDAVKKRKDGIVIIDPEKAKGRKDIAGSCPYGAIVWNDNLKLPQTWIFDAHLLDQGWERPRCQQSCPTGVFEAVKISVRKGEEIVGSAISDAYGEFKVDKIPANSGDYQVFIEHEDFHPLIVDVTVSQSEYIGAKEMQAK